jgi:hypothetical protein
MSGSNVPVSTAESPVNVLKLLFPPLLTDHVISHQISVLYRNMGIIRQPQLRKFKHSLLSIFSRYEKIAHM